MKGKKETLNIILAEAVPLQIKTDSGVNVRIERHGKIDLPFVPAHKDVFPHGEIEREGKRYAQMWLCSKREQNPNFPNDLLIVCIKHGLIEILETTDNNGN